MCRTRKKRVTILYTADEHGWFVESPNADGAAGMMQIWKEKEGFSHEADSFLVLSGGDMWMGASASTWFKGQSMFEIMNVMGYDAVAVGNHEFDFSLDTLKARAERSPFPYLAANIIDENGEVPSFLKPYYIVEANGVKVGLLGLANVETPFSTLPDAVKGLKFAPYDEIIKKYVPEIKKNGADVVIVLGHICKTEMLGLTALAAELNIPLITGGHCHDEFVQEQDGVLMIETLPFLTSYIKVVMEYDSKTKKTSILSYEIVKNMTETRDDKIGNLVEKWKNEANLSLSLPIGHTDKVIQQWSQPMYDLIMKSWILHFPDADLFITNQGSIRQNIEKGDKCPSFLFICDFAILQRSQKAL